MSTRLLSTSVNAGKLRDARILLYSRCIEEEHPEILRELRDGRVALSVCLTEEHINDVGFKLSTILMMARPREISVLTMDGSPHCIQLHFAIQQSRRLTGAEIEIHHYVIEKGKVYEVDGATIRTARHLSEVQKLRSLTKTL